MDHFFAVGDDTGNTANQKQNIIEINTNPNSPLKRTSVD